MFQEGKLGPITSAFPAGIVFKQLNIFGTAVGNIKDAAEVLDLATRGATKISPRVEFLEKLDDVSWRTASRYRVCKLTVPVIQVCQEVSTSKPIEEL